MSGDAVEQAAEALGRETSVRGVLHVTCRQLVDVLDGSACSVSRVVGDLLIGLEEFNQSGGSLELQHEYLISDFPLTQEVVERGEPRLVSLLDPDPEPNEAALLERLGFDSLLMVCLPSEGRCWGLVEVYAEGRRFDEGKAVLAERIAARAGEMLEKVVSREES